MGYLKIRLLLSAAEEAFDSGKLTEEQFIKIINDIENDLIRVDKLKVETDFNEIIKSYQ